MCGTHFLFKHVLRGIDNPRSTKERDRHETSRALPLAGPTPYVRVVVLYVGDSLSDR